MTRQSCAIKCPARLPITMAQRYPINNINKIAIGKRLTPSPLGRYSIAGSSASLGLIARRGEHSSSMPTGGIRHSSPSLSYFAGQRHNKPARQNISAYAVSPITAAPQSGQPPPPERPQPPHHRRSGANHFTAISRVLALTERRTLKAWRLKAGADPAVSGVSLFEITEREPCWQLTSSSAVTKRGDRPGKWLAVSGKIGCFASRDVRRIAVNHGVQRFRRRTEWKYENHYKERARGGIPRLFGK